MRHTCVPASAQRVGSLILLLLAWLLLTPLAAVAEGPDSTADRFADGDVLKITAYGRDDLTGQYIVQPGPLLSLPLIGTVQLAGRTARDLETTLSTAWENRLGSPMSVTVEFSQRAPFYVIGAVRSPGAYPYRGGLTVLQAIALSGGIIPQQTISDSARIDLIRESERRMQAIETLARAKARQARLQAERDGSNRVDVHTTSAVVPEARMVSILQEEARLLESRAKQYAMKEQQLSVQIKLGEAEIGSYQKQLKQMEGQKAQLAKEALRIRRVPGQQVRSFELEQRATSLETTMASINASISRATIQLEAARNEVASMQDTRQREITEALLEADQAIKASELTIAAAQDALATGGNAELQQTLSFRLLRNGKDEIKDVDTSTSLEIGDVLDVSISTHRISQSNLQAAQ